MEQDQMQRGLLPPEGKFSFGYDLGCKVERTVVKSLMFSLTECQKLLMLISILHGHAHQHLCQLTFLLIYVIGAGMENLKQYEWYFSKLNMLGGVMQYMSMFHHCQAIVHYAAHTDKYETYANLSKFIYTNYQSALNTLAGLGKMMEALQALGITNIEICSQWLKNEQCFLEERKDLSQPMMAEREYLSKLKALVDCQ
ncbi:hypothetical protein Moror_5104 [Moniliophthora roreri MCA 2997]|uniref:Uncharacterized protein n=1 Tax=Moniliophthora roreri (strain MCA 2997) TaxID=1381753 RepID=V2XQ03_MONRO|nr:hypothetical protein Moror_5104 [Moniliophthora roreri MCA 2997]